MNIGRFLARATIGGLFIGHGTQKLFGWFGGPGIEGTAGMMEQLELRPGRRNALAAAIAETAGGALLAAGALMPLAAAMLTGSMATAIRKVHLDKGLWNTAGGYEFNLTLVAAAIALVEAGPGKPSVDEALGLELDGNGWALAALAAGVAASTAAIEAGKRVPAAEPGTARTGRFARGEEGVEDQIAAEGQA
jgi:putative oxidoreductase